MEYKLPSNRFFGIFFTVIFLFFGFYSYFKSENLLASVFFSLAFLSLLLSIFYPHLLSPFNRYWMLLGVFLGKIASPIILGLMFFCILSPVALVVKMFRRDELNLNWKIVRKSLWEKRDSKNIDANRFKQQF